MTFSRAPQAPDFTQGDRKDPDGFAIGHGVQHQRRKDGSSCMTAVRAKVNMAAVRSFSWAVMAHRAMNIKCRIRVQTLIRQAPDLTAAGVVCHRRPHDRGVDRAARDRPGEAVAGLALITRTRLRQH